MVKHQERHPLLDHEGCFGCRVASVRFSVEAMPSRRPYEAATVASERGLSKDLDAFRTARREGLQPETVRGTAKLMATAETRAEIESPRSVPT